MHIFNTGILLKNIIIDVLCHWDSRAAFNNSLPVWNFQDDRERTVASGEKQFQSDPGQNYQVSFYFFFFSISLSGKNLFPR